MKKHKWIILKDYGEFNCFKFSFLVDVNSMVIKYDILELKFYIQIRLIWFTQNRRRNFVTQIDKLHADVYYDIPFEKIFSMAYFKKLINNETDVIKNAEIIQREINENEVIRNALFMKYVAILCKKPYNEQATSIFRTEKIGSINDVLNMSTNIFGCSEDNDFSEVTQIAECVISTY